MDIVIVMNTPVFQSICTNNMTHYSDGCVYSDGYTRISEELYKQHDTQ